MTCAARAGTGSPGGRAVFFGFPPFFLAGLSFTGRLVLAHGVGGKDRDRPKGGGNAGGACPATYTDVFSEKTDHGWSFSLCLLCA